MILTDSEVLANKYSCSQQDVYDVFNDFIQTAYDQQMYWSFLDAATTQLASSTAAAIIANAVFFITIVFYEPTANSSLRFVDFSNRITQ